MKSIKKTLILFSLIFLNIFSTSLQAVTQEDLQEFAIKNNDSELIEILMRYGDQSYPLLNRAMESKDYFTVFILIEYGIDINTRAYSSPYPTNVGSHAKTVMEMAIERNEPSLVEFFLLKKADPTIPFYTYEKQSDGLINNYFKTAVYDAIILDRLDVLILFAQHSVDLNKICYESKIAGRGRTFNQTPFQVAVARKKKEIVNFLLSCGVDF